MNDEAALMYLGKLLCNVQHVINAIEPAAGECLQMWKASYAAGEHSAEHMTLLITFHRSSLLEIRSGLNPIIQELRKHCRTNGGLGVCLVTCRGCSSSTNRQGPGVCSLNRWLKLQNMQ